LAYGEAAVALRDALSLVSVNPEPLIFYGRLPLCMQHSVFHTNGGRLRCDDYSFFERPIPATMLRRLPKPFQFL
jgi:hypothetical protein